jgi:hypothetical protein
MVTVLVGRVQPPLVLALQFVVEDDPLDARAALQQPRGGVFVRAVDLEVMFQLALPHEAGMERLITPVVRVAMPFQQLASGFGQDDGVITVAGHPSGLDEPLCAQVPQVARPRVRGSLVVVPEITTGDHSEGADGRQRPRLGAAQGVLAVPAAYYLTLGTSREVDMAAERIGSALRSVQLWAFPLRPARVLRAVAGMFVRALAVVPGTTARRSHVALIVVAQSGVGLPPVVITTAIIGGAVSSLARRVGASLVVAGVVVARIEIHTVVPSCLWTPNSSSPRRSTSRMKSEQQWRPNCFRAWSTATVQTRKEAGPPPSASVYPPQRPAMTLTDRIEIDPDVMLGKPVRGDN